MYVYINTHASRSSYSFRTHSARRTKPVQNRELDFNAGEKNTHLYIYINYHPLPERYQIWEEGDGERQCSCLVYNILHTKVFTRFPIRFS